MSKKLQLIFALLSAGTTTFAQLDTSSKALDPVIVTANKLPQKQSSTGKVVTLITKEQIEKSGGKTLSQLLNEQAGITIAGALNNLGTNQSLFLRGAASGRSLILIDGIPVYDPSVISNEFDLNLISLNNVECIEVCRGAQSTIYGSDAIAGVINIITTKNQTNKPFGVKILGSAGNYNTYRSGIDISGNYRKLTYSAKYGGLFSQGFSAAHDSSGNKNFDRDGFKGTILNSTVKYQVTSSISIKGFVQYSHDKTDVDAAAFIDEKDYSFKNNAVILGSSFLYSSNKISLTANYQYSTNKRDYVNDSLDAPGFTKYSKDRYKGKSQFLDIYSRMTLGNGFTLLQGADYRHSSMNSQNFSLSSFGPFKSEFRDTSHSQASIYTSLFYNSPNGKFNTDLGGRINVHSQYGTNSTFTLNPSYVLNSHYRLMGSIASAFKAPTLYQLYSPYGNKSLQPEKSTTYEVGIEQKHKTISNRLIYFHRKIKQGIDFNYISFNYFNINEQTVSGIELESKLQPIESFFLAVNYTYLHPEENSQSRISFKDTVYQYLLRRPNHRLNVSAGYELKERLFMSVNLNYVSKRYDIGGYKLSDVLLKSYFLLNAYAEYNFPKRLKLFADFQNITGKKFFDIRGYNSIPFLFTSGFKLSL